MRIENQKRNFDESRTRLARSSAECCNPKGLQNGAKSFELSNISRQQNFGAIKIQPKNTPKITQLMEKGENSWANQFANVGCLPQRFLKQFLMCSATVMLSLEHTREEIFGLL